MDMDKIAPGLERLIDPKGTLDAVAHGMTFGEGPVWDRRTGQLYWVDIIGNSIWKWKPGVGKEQVMHPTGFANGMTFDKEGRLMVCGWSRSANHWAFLPARIALKKRSPSADWTPPGPK